MNTPNSKQNKVRISFFLDPPTLALFKDTAARTNTPYQRLLRDALHFASLNYLPRFEAFAKELTHFD